MDVSEPECFDCGLGKRKGSYMAIPIGDIALDSTSETQHGPIRFHEWPAEPSLPPGAIVKEPPDA